MSPVHISRDKILSLHDFNACDWFHTTLDTDAAFRLCILCIFCVCLFYLFNNLYIFQLYRHIFTTHFPQILNMFSDFHISPTYPYFFSHFTYIFPDIFHLFYINLYFPKFEYYSFATFNKYSLRHQHKAFSKWCSALYLFPDSSMSPGSRDSGRSSSISEGSTGSSRCRGGGSEGGLR